MLVIVALTVVIGFRFNVGGDWHSYLRYLSSSYEMTYSDLGGMEDPGYWALNILATQLGFGITGVNTFGAFLFSIGLVLLCRSLSRPWLALACAMPYLVTVVSMGYTRQAIALGLVMIGLVMLGRQKFAIFALWVLAGALFHKSAVVLIPIALLTASKNRFLTLSLVAAATALGYFTLLEDSATRLVATYVDKNIESEGAFIRLAMNAVPAILFLIYRKRFALSPAEKKLWLIFSLMAISMFFAFFATNLSTALDRMALYIIPLQLVVFAQLPEAIGTSDLRNRQYIVALILFYYATILFVWLNFANHSTYWVPYQIRIG
ncbi:EpsG family protein [Henriciella marina]|uniref:EpsG family protein n=1 Tax=Henriciella marina TaxID=453851 RepID=UPI0003A5EED6|nr:EpsG family protein [Henriciella marina]